MACDPNTLLDQAKCYQCLLTGDLFPAVEIVLLCAWRDGTILSCDPQILVAQASCIRSCIPLGMMAAVKTAILCDIASGIVTCIDPEDPTNLEATAPSPETTLSWTDNATNETSYQVRYQNITQGGGFVSPTSYPPDTTGAVIVITGAADGDSIEIQVRAVNGSCVSAWVSVTVTAVINN